MSSKGKHWKWSEEYKREIKKRMKGKHTSLKTEFKKGNIPWNKGKHLSEITRKKLSETRKKLGLSKGDKNPFWKGGINTIAMRIRRCGKYKEWQQSILIRDDFTCQDCWNKIGNNLIAHHKKSFEKLLQEVKKYLSLLPLYEGAMLYTPLWDINNGITLCRKCHNKLHNKIKGVRKG